MSEETPPAGGGASSNHTLGLIEYALITALVAVVVIGVLVVLAPAITNVVHAFQGG